MHAEQMTAELPSGRSTWATRPSASAMSGKIWLITDIGNGVLVRSDGTRWLLMAPVRIYANSGDLVVTNTTTSTEVATFTIPAEMLGDRGMLTFFVDWGQTNSGNQKQIQIVFGGATLINVAGFASTTTISGIYHIRNVTATSQVGTNTVAPGVGTSNGALSTATVDTNSDVVVSVFMKMLALAETITVKNLYVELKQ